MTWRVNSDPIHVTRGLTIRTGLSVWLSLCYVGAVAWRCSAGTMYKDTWGLYVSSLHAVSTCIILVQTTSKHSAP